MEIIESLQCKICLCAFDIEERKPLIGTCGHSLCSACCKKIRGRCPQCRGTFFSRVVNYQLLELLSDSSLPEHVKNLKKKFNSCSECDSKLDSPQLCVTCASNLNILIKLGNIDECEFPYIWNNNRSNPSNYTTMARSMRICQKCAGDENHKDHTVKSYEFVKRECHYGIIKKELKKALDDFDNRCKQLQQKIDKYYNILRNITRDYEKIDELSYATHYNSIFSQLKMVEKALENVYNVRHGLEYMNNRLKVDVDYIKSKNQLPDKANSMLVGENKIFFINSRGEKQEGRQFGKKIHSSLILENMAYIAFKKDGIFYLQNYDKNTDTLSEEIKLNYKGRVSFICYHDDNLMMIFYDYILRENFLMKYDLKTTEFTKICNIEDAVPKQVHLISIDSKIYLIKKKLSTCLCDNDVIEIFDEEKKQFSFLTSLPDNRKAYSVCAYNGMIYIMGGTSTINEKKVEFYSVFYYNPVINKWEEGPKLLSKKITTSNVQNGHLNVVYSDDMISRLDIK